MSRRNVSERDFLIEQILQDCNEGFVDNIKAGLAGARDWLKADVRNSFKLRSKRKIENDRNYSAAAGKIRSYAKSIAQTLNDFKRVGGTLGKGMRVNDVIMRLNQVAQGKISPRR